MKKTENYSDHFYMYLFNDGSTAPFSIAGKEIIGVWYVYIY
jgi:hypothetical protein